MIRHEAENGVWLYTQNVHAFMCGQISRLWNFLPCEPEDELHTAALLHDLGWVERDQNPQINADDKPRTFTELDLDNHFEVWRRSITRAADVNRYAGLLVSLHCSDLYHRRLNSVNDSQEDRAKIETFLENQRLFEQSLQTELIPKYGKLVESEHLQHNRKQLQAWDWMSLVLLMGIHREAHSIPVSSEHTLRLWTDADNTSILYVTPWVFSVPQLTLYAEGRWLDQLIFKDDTELQQAYHAASLQIRTFKILPGR